MDVEFFSNDDSEVCDLVPHAVDVKPTNIIIFGATGDLTHRKIFPALYNLWRTKKLPEGSRLIGVARRDLSRESFCAGLNEAARKFVVGNNFDEKYLASLLARVEYLKGDIFDARTYETLRENLQLDGVERNTVFYLATEAEHFVPVLHGLGAVGLGSLSEDSLFSRRVIIEKPFGRDGRSAAELNAVARAYFREVDIFRIDHYLGKETVQNLLYFRFANSIFEPLWNNGYIDHVQITVSESLGVGSRGGYYDHSGATRDMLQNHLFQLLTLLAMEPPSSLDAEAIRDEKVKVLRSVAKMSKQKVLQRTVRGQYSAGALASGEVVPGYRETEKVSENSRTETFVAAVLEIDNWRWSGVPFFLRTGKALSKQVSEIVIAFKRPPGVLFAGFCGEKLRPNRLTIRVQPDEGIVLQFNAKRPGRDSVQRVNMDFCYRERGWESIPEAYERLVLDVLMGDSTLFTRWDEVQASWQVIDMFLDAWESHPDSKVVLYPAGGEGPKEAFDLIASSGRLWKGLAEA